MKCLQLLLAAVFLCYMTAFGQKDKKIEPRIYAFDEKGNNVNDINKAATYEVVISENDTTHILRVYKNFGPMIKQEVYLDKDLTIPNGRFVWYDQFGGLDSTGIAIRGKKDGRWEYFNTHTWKDSKGKYIDSLMEIKYYSKGRLVNKEAYYGFRDTTGRKKAEYKNGVDGWRNYLIKNLNASIGQLVTQYPLLKPLNQAEVVIGFIVSGDGDVSDRFLFHSAGYPFDLEVFRILGNCGKWTPAQEGGLSVPFMQRQSITFRQTQ